MADSSSSSSVNTNLPDVTSARSDHVPVQVTTVQLHKENYSRWSPAITMGIAGRGRIAYVNGKKVESAEDSMAWDTWYLEDNQVKTWIVNSVSPDIQPLILRKKTARDMWIILEQMYGQKKKKVRVYQLMKDVYSLRQGALSVADFYAALKSKWEDLDYHSDITWKCPHDQMQYMTDKWENRVFVFLSGLNDDFENIRSQILNSDESFSIEDVYSRVEAEEQRRMLSSGRKGEEQSAYVSQQIRELRAYLSKIDVGQADTPDEEVLGKDEEGTTTDVHEQEKEGEQPMLTGQEGNRRFGQVYSRRGTCIDKVINDEEVTPNPNPTPSLDDPSRAQKQDVGREIQTDQEKEDLPIALRKGVSKTIEQKAMAQGTTATVNNARATTQDRRRKRGDTGGGGNSDGGIEYGGGGSGSGSCGDSCSGGGGGCCNGSGGGCCNGSGGCSGGGGSGERY
ncbi:hypothetical protein EJ110_NYTH42474 [Nymphaea thermarum]|nr:hypothetical protein EJ110_NYTH42474 [Nymphaea thermarum]